MIGKLRPSLLFLQDKLAVWIKTIISFLYYKWHFGVVEHNIRNFQKSDSDPILYMDTCRIVSRIRFAGDTPNGLTSNSKERTAESVKGQRAVAPLTLINE